MFKGNTIVLNVLSIKLKFLIIQILKYFKLVQLLIKIDKLQMNNIHQLTNASSSLR